MVGESQKVNWQVVNSELEALLVEAELIKTHQPPYNILLKDDKSPLYLYLTNDVFPQLKTIPAKDLHQKNVPVSKQFGPYPSGYQAKKLLTLTRRLFPFCSATVTERRQKKACFYYHLGLCPGACVGKIGQRAYRQHITNLSLFLKGKKRSVIARVKKEMQQKAAQEKFEQARVLRDRLFLLTKLFTRPHPLPPDIRLPQLEVDQQKEKLVYFRRLLRRYFSLPSKYPLDRIEAYDISTTSGSHPTGSLVVFDNGKPDTKSYRRFSIKGENALSDTKRLQEVITRRLRHREWPKPTLVLIDGGSPQVKAVKKVFPWNIPVIGLAKNPDRLVFIIHGKAHTHLLPPNNPATHLAQHIRNESHRFAKAYHQHLRQKNLTTPL